jgi:hypothetical protein
MMRHYGQWTIYGFIPLGNSPNKIYVFKIHEKPFIKQANLPEYGASEKHKTAGQ